MDLSNAITAKDGTHIIDSCLVKSKQAMRDYLEQVREMADPEMAVWKRDIESQVHEWRARSRTRDVDLELKQPWYRELFCRVVSFFYFWD